MSSYKPSSRHPVEGEMRMQPDVDWREFTPRRLAWLYGPGRENTPESLADLASWRALGRRSAA